MTWPPGCGAGFIAFDLQELIVPALWEQDTFSKKLGAEKEGQMWLFQDRGQRNCCLVPEVTAIVQEQWRDRWSKQQGALGLFYISRCYRYDRPQAGRYREFTQVGIELLGNIPQATKRAKDILDSVLREECTGLVFQDQVKRGLSYYCEDGFEVEATWLGAQKQVAGGGRYSEGVGWAIGLDRLDLAMASKPVT
jgi:histidyl-tRNA synthetase